ncbi:MAG: 3-phosphoshikimate 1-carboxyvinyltransferase, partial [Planctomycetota bacterium JB042]
MARRPSFRVRRADAPLRGRLVAARDKSITHRAILLGALADGETRIEAPLAASADVARTVAAAERLGASVNRDGDALLVRGPVRRETSPWDLDAGASGTTARLLLGVLAGLGAASRLDGDRSLRRRPMARVTRRLAAMGARFSGAADALPVELLPGGALVGVDHELEVASAQVSSACLLAGLFASGTTRVTVPGPCRDHTERMFAAFSIPVRRDGRTSAVDGPVAPSPARLRVPVDLSSALYPAVLALLVPGSDLLLEEVGVNPTRTGALDVLTRMGADLAEEAPRR